MKKFIYIITAVIFNLLLLSVVFGQAKSGNNLQASAKVREKFPAIIKSCADAKSKRIRFVQGAYTAQVKGKFSKIGENVFFTVKAEKAQRMIVNIIPSAYGLATAGVVIAPSGEQDGQPGGPVFNSVLKESGDYKIRVSQRPTEHKFPAEFIVEVIILPSFLN